MTVTLCAATATLTVGVFAFAITFNGSSINRFHDRADLLEELTYQHPVVLPTRRPLEHLENAIIASSRVPLFTPDAAGFLPAAMNLNLPFTSQAPHGDWTLPYKEFCEEASVLMVVRYLRHQPILTSDDAAASLAEIRLFEEKTFGSYADTSVRETAAIITKHFNYPRVRLLENPTVPDIKRALAAGQPVIVPAAGRQLHNPYFTPPGPLYHMLVIKGYTAMNQFITNDPGTRRGADFLYDTDLLMNAIHDWPDDENIEQGRKIVLIVG